jgi:hypothetical protein
VRACERRWRIAGNPVYEANTQHFKNTLRYIQNKQRAHRDAPEPSDDAEGEEKPADWSAVDVVGGCLKMGLA